MKVIPAIDIINGKCVRLSKGDYNTQKIYNENPLEVAKEFQDYGIEYLHLVDLDGARSKHITNQKILEQIASKTNLKIDFGGGLKTTKDICIAFDCGAWKVTGGSIALQDPQLFLQWLARFGADKIILGADCKDEKIVVNGWLQGSEQDVIAFIKKYTEKGIKDVISTDISKDGILAGPSFKLYKKILSKINTNLIASGGICCVEDLEKLKEMGCSGAIIGKAIYERRITLKQLSRLC